MGQGRGRCDAAREPVAHLLQLGKLGVHVKDREPLGVRVAFPAVRRRRDRARLQPRSQSVRRVVEHDFVISLRHHRLAWVELLRLVAVRVELEYVRHLDRLLVAVVHVDLHVDLELSPARLGHLERRVVDHCHGIRAR
eukprot:scaffold17413_cov72-Phaeocystis_antarctica.AAC.7